MMKMYNPYMGMGMGIVQAVLNVHVCINLYPEFRPLSTGHLPIKLFENPLLLHLGHPIWVGGT